MSQTATPATLARLVAVCPFCCLAWSPLTAAEPCPICGPQAITLERAKPFTARRRIILVANPAPPPPKGFQP